MVQLFAEELCLFNKFDIMTSIKNIFNTIVSRGPVSVGLAVIVSVLFVTGIVNAATTISTNINTGGTLTVTGASTLGTVTATSINGNTITTGTGVLTLATGKTLTANSTLTFAGTDGTTMTFPSTSATIARTDAANTFTGVQTMTSPVLITPALGVATATSIAIGGGTAVTKISVLTTGAITPVATAAAIGTTQQTFAVASLLTTDKIIVNGPVPTSLCPMTGYRVSANDILQLDFTTLTALACTPAAGTYNIVMIRN